MINTDHLKRLLESLILGKHMPAWSCCCGALSKKEAIAVGIQGPHETGYPQFVGKWHHWTVKMREVDKAEGYQYSVGVSRFISRDELERLFESVAQPNTVPGGE